MNDICPSCGNDLVNIIYGYPSPKMVEMAKEENIALGGCVIRVDSPRLYCYGCDSTFLNLQETSTQP